MEALCLGKNLCSWENQKRRKVLVKKKKKTELHASVQISNKGVAAKPKIVIHKVKKEVSFHFTSTSHDTKSSTIASNRNFDCRFVVLLLSIFSVFSILPRGFPLPLATLPIIVSSFSTLHWTIEIKGKRVCNWLHWRQEVPFSYWFAVSGGVIICWRDARRTLWVLMS